jgi:hypothetical protein
MAPTDRNIDAVLGFLKVKAEAASRHLDCTPDQTLYMGAHDLIVSLRTSIVETKQRLVDTQRKLGEYECREIGGGVE